MGGTRATQQFVSSPAMSCPAPAPAQTNTKPAGMKPCCACPDTKRARDECVIERGEEHCAAFIEAHKVRSLSSQVSLQSQSCMRSYGFKI